MVGPPGAGKGTQATLLAERLGLPKVASGELFRAALRDDTPIGREARRFMERGQLVPDATTGRLIESRLSEADAAEGVILDGYPRTRPQAEALDSLLARKGGQVAAALYVEVGRDELERRLSGRWVCRQEDHVYHTLSRPPLRPGICDIDGSPLYQREDDRPETVRARLAVQLPPMYEVVDHYSDRGVLSSVDGARPIGEVTEELLRAIAQPIR